MRAAPLSSIQEAIMKLGTYDYSTGEAHDACGVLLGCFANHHEARQAMMTARLPVQFWRREEVSPIPLLQQLNNWVIKQNERRLPKWKFRFTPALAIQIQPRVTRVHALLFQCVALQTEMLSVKCFIEPSSLHDQSYWQIKFNLFADEQASTWTFNPPSARRGQRCPVSGYLDLRQSIVDVLHPSRFTQLTPDRMLSPHCLCCGKALTDPASVARWIGPECWSSASTNLLRIFNTSGDQIAEATHDA
jgi:hypothetical protein